MGVTDNIVTWAPFPPARAAKLDHSVLHKYYDVDSFCPFSPSLSHFMQLKISGAVRHVGVCLMPITPMTTATISEIKEGSDGLRSSEPAFPFLRVHVKEPLLMGRTSLSAVF